MVDITENLRAELISVAHEMADAARAAILPHFRASGLIADNKSADAFDPVTIGDRAGETAMRDVLARRRPRDGILGEEHGTKVSESGLTWVLDPIDGTRGFISGTPTWGVLVSLRDQSGPLLGVIDQPYIRERFIGGFGLASVEGPSGTASLKSRNCTQLDQATIFTTFPEVGTAEEGKAFHRVAQRCKLTRYGMDCYAYALLAAGQVDLVIEAGLAPYDIQAPIAVVQAAGGVLTDWQGNPVHDGGCSLAAATPELHAAAMTLLNE